MGKELPTKEKIKLEALDLFSTLGFKGTPVRTIAKNVGIRESTIYSHFKNKEDILKSIVEDFKSSAISAEIITNELIDYIDKPQRFMKKFCEKIFEYWNSPYQRKTMRLFLIEQFAPHEGADISLNIFLEDLRSVWRFVFEQFQKFKLIKKLDAGLLADEFISYLYLIRLEYLVDREGKNLGKALKLAKSHVEFIWKTIKA